MVQESSEVPRNQEPPLFRSFHVVNKQLSSDSVGTLISDKHHQQPHHQPGQYVAVVYDQQWYSGMMPWQMSSHTLWPRSMIPTSSAVQATSTFARYHCTMCLVQFLPLLLHPLDDNMSSRMGIWKELESGSRILQRSIFELCQVHEIKFSII